MRLLPSVSITMSNAISRLTGMEAEAAAIELKIAEEDVSAALLRALKQRRDFDSLVSSLLIPEEEELPSFDVLCEIKLAWDRDRDRERKEAENIQHVMERG